MPKLINWEIVGNDDRYRIWGDVYGSQKFADGEEIHTSRIVKMERKGTVFEIQTKNTLYHCPMSAILLYENRIPDVTMSCLEHHGFEKEETVRLMDRIYDAFGRVDGKKRKFLRRILTDCEKNSILLEFSSEEPYYFRFWMKKEKREKWTYGDGSSLHVFVKPEQLSAEIRDSAGDQVLFRFLPYEEKRLRICDGMEQYSKVFVRNGGFQTLTIETDKNTYSVKPGDYCRIE